ncbi:unnamed protein product [Lupinus luteus]|uniref:Uncharacterized protein n=1 Tax=Lupinus luteus TaxID=3873 RepID=A0AAV1WI51_LUPLU
MEAQLHYSGDVVIEDHGKKQELKIITKLLGLSHNSNEAKVGQKQHAPGLWKGLLRPQALFVDGNTCIGENLRCLLIHASTKGYYVFGGGWERSGNVFEAAESFPEKLNRDAATRQNQRTGRNR